MPETKYIITALHSDDLGMKYTYYITNNKHMLVWNEKDATQFDTLPAAQAFIKDNLGKLKTHDIVKTTIVKLTKTNMETTTI